MNKKNPSIIISISDDVLKSYFANDVFMSFLDKIQEGREVLKNLAGSIEIEFKVIKESSGKIEFDYVGGKKTTFILPSGFAPLSLHICFAKSVFVSAKTALEQYFPYQAWVSREELEHVAKKGFPVEVWKAYSLIDILCTVLREDPKAGFLNDVSLQYIIDESHDLSLDTRASISLEKVVIDMGLSRILSIAKNLARYTNQRVDMSRLIDACLLADNENDEAIIKEYLGLGMRLHPDEYQGGDGACRVLLLSQDTCDDLQDEFLKEADQPGFGRNIKTRELSENLIGVTRLCSERGVLPLVILYSGEDAGNIAEIGRKIKGDTGKCFFIEQGLMSIENEFLPLFRI